MTHTVVLLLAFGASIVFILLWAAARQLMAQPIKPGGVEACPLEEMPPHLRRAFEEPLNALGQLGFHAEHCEVGNSIFGVKNRRTWSVHCTNQRDRSMAVVYEPSRPDLESSKVSFYSRDRSGSQFWSLSWQEHMYIAGLPGWTFEDTRTKDLEKGYRIHLRQRNGRVAEPRTIDQPDRIAEAQRFLDAYVKYLKDAGWTQQVSENEYRFKLLPALRLALRVLVGEFRARNYLRRHRPASFTGSAGASPEVAVDVYKRFEGRVAQSRPIHWAVKLVVFGVSAVVFCLVFGFVIVTSWVTVILLAVAVLFHELGHLAGMWMFGYRDLQILFIPAFGAMAMGIKEEVKPWQRAVVVFLGPMPGLLVSCVLLIAQDFPAESWQFQLLVIMFVINYINLLPVLPFDGGVIFDLSVAQRLPYMTSVLTCISVLVFGVAGIYLSDVILLALAGFLLLTLRSQWWMAKAQQTLRQQVPAGNDDEVLHRIFAEFRKPEYSRLSFGSRVQFARKFLSQRKNGDASLLLSVTCLAMQVLTLAVPLIVWFAFVRE
jgi:Zn-dependent protease